MSLPKGNNIFRAVHYPLSFNKRNAFIVGKFIHLGGDESRIEMSVVWERYAPMVSYVHDYGCRTSTARNELKRSRGQSGRDVYCGAFQFKVHQVCDLVGIAQVPEIVHADVVHVIETDEIAHANIGIDLANVSNGGKLEELKTVIVDRLWQVSRGPLRHQCVCDQHLNPHPSNAIPNPPSGAYADDRPAVCRAWYIVRYWVVASLWRSGVIPLAGVYRSSATQPAT
jgi:hypothetical protein